MATSTITAAHYIDSRGAEAGYVTMIPGGAADDAELEAINDDATVTFVEQAIGYGEYTHVACIGTEYAGRLEQRYAIVARA